MPKIRDLGINVIPTGGGGLDPAPQCAPNSRWVYLAACTPPTPDKVKKLLTTFCKPKPRPKPGKVDGAGLDDAVVAQLKQQLEDRIGSEIAN